MRDARVFERLVELLAHREVRFVLIGVGGANFWAQSAGTVLATQDHVLFLPADAGNLLAAWEACREVGFDLRTDTEPLGEPLDERLAKRVSEHRASTRAVHPSGLEVDLTMEMAGFDFDTVWRERREFLVAGQPLPVARLAHIVESKAKADRPKDRLFLATWEDTLRRLLEGGSNEEDGPEDEARWRPGGHHPAARRMRHMSSSSSGSQRNGSTTRTPAKSIPSCRSSDKSVEQPAALAASTIDASQ